MLTAGHHPCQALADLLTLREAFGRARRAASSPTSATATTSRARSRSLGAHRRRRGRGRRRRPATSSSRRRGADARRPTRPRPSRGAHAVYTDVWVSMGDEDTADERRAALAPYRIDDALLDRAAPGAIALHCLPAHPGEEITAEVLYGDRAARSGTRRRTAATRRRRCSSGCSADAGRRRTRRALGVRGQGHAPAASAGPDREARRRRPSHAAMPARPARAQAMLVTLATPSRRRSTTPCAAGA